MLTTTNSKHLFLIKIEIDGTSMKRDEEQILFPPTYCLLMNHINVQLIILSFGVSCWATRSSSSFYGL